MRDLDERVAAVDGHGFAVTPFARAATSCRAARLLGRRRRLGEGRDRATSPARTRRATCSACSLQLEVAERRSWIEPARAARARDRELRQRGARRRGARGRGAAAALRVFVPDGRRPGRARAAASSSARPGRLPARARRRRRPDLPRPARGARRRARCRSRARATCNGLAVEGGTTLGYELVSELGAAGRLDRAGRPGRRRRARERLLPARCRRRVRSACCAGCRGSTPCRRARRVAAAARLRPACGSRRRRRASSTRHAPLRVHVAVGDGAAEHRARDPRRRDLRLARGRRGDARDRRQPVVVGEDTLADANDARARGRPASTSTTPARRASPACSRSARRGDVGADERVAVLFTGVTRDAHRPQTKGADDEKLSRQGHPVAQGLRARRVRARLRGVRRARADRAQPAERRPARRQDAADGLLPAEHAHAARDRGGDAPARRPRARVLRREDDPRRRLLPGVDQGHGPHARVLRRRHRDAPLPAGRARRGGAVGVGAGDQLRRRLGRAPDAGADRPLHDAEGARARSTGSRSCSSATCACGRCTRSSTPPRSSTSKAYVVGPPEMSLLPEFKAELDELQRPLQGGRRRSRT